MDGFSPRNLARMRKFYVTYKDMANLPPTVANLPWTHNFVLIEKVSTPNNDYLIDLLFYHLDLRCYVVERKHAQL